MIFGLVLVGSLLSCQKWLDTKPDESIYAEEVLTDRQGFARALAGVYHKMGDAALYGRELEFGMMDVMAGYWQIGKHHVYHPDYNFDYRAEGPKHRITGIWAGLYSSIHDCNVILEQVDKIKTDPYYALIKGEVLGLRAFLHFEALKLFGPTIKQKGLNAAAVPYYTSSSRKAQAFLSSRACFNLMEQDLQQAKALLANDPIITQGRVADGNKTGSVYNSLIDRRGIHLNYYAVLALLARKSQWEGDMQAAAARAQFLLDQLNQTQAVRFMRPAEITEVIHGQGDIRFTKENIFGLYINDMVEVKKDYFPVSDVDPNRALATEYNPFLLSLFVKDADGDMDVRLSAWGIFSTYIRKLVIPTGTESIADPNHYEAQLINLPEIYFILVEAFSESDPEKGVNYLNAVRRARGVPELKFASGLTKDKLLDKLLDEIRREYIGEGCLFTYYKHLNHGIYYLDGLIQADDKIFMLPIPDEEQRLNQGY